MTLARGDRVIVTENTKALKKGSFCTVESLTAPSPGQTSEAMLSLAVDGGETVSVSVAAKDVAMAYGYAVTADKSQGLTQDRAYVLAYGMDRHRLYVAMSRHREDCQVYGSLSDSPTIASIIDQARVAHSGETIGANIDLETAARGGLETTDERLTAWETRSAEGTGELVAKEKVWELLDTSNKKIGEEPLLHPIQNREHRAIVQYDTICNQLSQGMTLA